MAECKHEGEWKPAPPPNTVTLPADDLLAEAYVATTGPRNRDYGDPTQNFHTISGLWTLLLQHKLKDGEIICPSEVGSMMVSAKQSRMIKSPGKRDNWRDLAGYARCGWMCVEEDGK